MKSRRRHTAKGGLQILIGLLCLTIGLWMEARSETDRSPQSQAECPPDMTGELGASVGDNILGDPMETKHMEDKQVSSLEGR